jgi:hypothetical protein
MRTFQVGPARRQHRGPMQYTKHLKFIALIAVAAWSALPVEGGSPHSISLTPIGTVAAGDFDASAAEIVAHDPKTQRLFVVNAQAAQIDIVDIRNPSVPAIVGTIDVKPYGAVANSVAVRDGIIAVAVENETKTSPGKVVFFDRDLALITHVTVGALPDMLTFSPNGKYVLVANEGEPNNQYTIDPEGSVSIIDLSKGVKKLTQSMVTTASFVPFNSTPIDPAIRIFGLNNPTVAQDLEPEYITVSQDSKTAWVTLQENNAMAIIDIPSATVKKLVPFGYKDHAAVAAATTLYNFDPASVPSIGTTLAGQPIPLGGFSGLAFEGIAPTTGNLKFAAHTDRGPNAEPTGINRPFLLPQFAPEVVRFELDRKTGKLTLTQRIQLKDSTGNLLTGLPNTSLSTNASQPYNDEVPVDLLGNVLPLDPLGADMEGIVFLADGTFWMCDEYRPALYHFDATGTLIRRVVPIGTAAAAGQPVGTYGEELLPAVLGQRRQNRGFEAIALNNGLIYAWVQSPLRNPVTASNSALNVNRNIRLVEFNPATNATREFIYVMDNPNLGAAPNSRADKIGDAQSLGNGEFLVLERDDDKLPDDAPATIEKKVYQFNLAGATPLTPAQSTGVIGGTGKTVDQLTVAEMVANSIRPVEKQLFVDLNVAGYNQVEKVEGLAVIDPYTIAVINDNDFGVAQITVNPDGTFTRNYIPEPIQIGIVEVRHNALDASDRDGAGNSGKINIRPWPIKGLYMPDAIASYKVGPKTFLLTANEGDAREYIVEDPITGAETPVYVENIRLGSSSVVLDPVKFPNAAVLKDSDNLGRLNITSASGRNPVTGRYEEIFAFGARSFSIWDADGGLVFDSGDDLERITAARYPANFNASNSNNDFDNRSDDKGPEPEGVVVGKAFGNDYAFIGLERIGGVVVYDISNPRAPFFVDYVNNRDFTQPVETPAAGDLGPEGLIFIKAEDSPTRKPLLVIANEVSGTTTIYEIAKVKKGDDDDDDDDDRD